MNKSTLLFVVLLLSACASFDRTNILPGQRVAGLGFSFSVPTDKAWFAVEYGTSHRIKLSQLNQDDRFTILVSLNKGPRHGMYSSPETHLKTVRYYEKIEPVPVGLNILNHREWIDSRYGRLCVRQSSFAEDWRGRNKPGPAMIDSVILSCPHQGFDNVLISIELSRRYEKHAQEVDITSYADALFSSLEFTDSD